MKKGIVIGIMISMSTAVLAAPLYNKAAYIPSQCYTKTKDKNGDVHNPCYSCHIGSKEPNYTNDWDLQLGYTFPPYAFKNRWKNLFKDRTKEVDAMLDSEIEAYVKTDNYMDENHTILLAKRLGKSWQGYVPDCYFAFDEEGFDKTPEGNFTGWRAFGYTPFLGTFWPTNGSMDDVLIRLPKLFRQDSKGRFSKEVYQINLLIVEALIKQKDIKTFVIDEKKYGVDLDKDGRLDKAEKIRFEYDVPRGKKMFYVGKAKESGAKIAAGLYPKGTEFLHSVRYLDSDANGTIMIAPRMKELRYGVKNQWADYNRHQSVAEAEHRERLRYPDRMERFLVDEARGVSNRRGWRYQGFIEDAKGDLRPQTKEETLFCIGCHSALGSVVDSTFAFSRKLEKGDYHDGWYHWGQKGLKGIAEPKRVDGKYEYTTYLKENHAGDEFRANDEVKKKFFDTHGTLKPEKIQALHHDISLLLLPSTKRAMMLNKAYKVIVDEQSFIYGRDAHVKPLKEVHETLKEGESTGVKKPVRYEFK